MQRLEPTESLSLGAMCYLAALCLRVFTALIGVTTLATSLDHGTILCKERDALCIEVQWTTNALVRVVKVLLCL